MSTPWGTAKRLRLLGVAFASGALLLGAVPACSATANVSDVWTSIDADGARRRSMFFADSAGITCLAQVGIGRKDVTVEILIRQIRHARFGTTNYETIDKVVSARDFHPDVTGTTPAVLALTMAPSSIDSATGKATDDADAPFEPGSYVCEVVLDGALQKTAAFNIDYAPCPTVAIAPSVRCLGFYVENDKCPAAGATGDPTPTCTCLPAGWSCP